MAVDMATADQILKIDYRDGIHAEYARQCRVFNMFQREGEEQQTSSDVYRIALDIAPSQGRRSYRRSPNQFARTDGQPEVRKADVTYPIAFNPIRINPDVVFRAANGDAAMIDMLDHTIKQLRKIECSSAERAACTGYGHDLLFEIASVPGGAPWTYGVENYAGVSGEPMGTILHLINLLNAWVNFADPTTSGTPAAYNTVRNGGAPRKITSWTMPIAGQTVTLNAEMVGATVGDVVYLSHDEAGGVQSTVDGEVGLAGCIDDFTLLNPFQTIASTDDTAMYFKSELINAGGVELNEDLLQRLDSRTSVLQGGDEEEGMGETVYVANKFTVDRFAQSLTTIANPGTASNRRVAYPVTREGFKPHYGYARQFLTYNGVPFVDSQLFFLKRLMKVNLSKETGVVMVRNGAAEGDFLTPAGGGPIAIRIAGGPLSEYVYYAMRTLAAHGRAGSGMLYNLATPAAA